MNPPPLRPRILKALELQDMTVDDLSRMLDAPPTNVSLILASLALGGSVRQSGMKAMGMADRYHEKASKAVLWGLVGR
jgi:DNA-binding IclR family transcriptional regulator